MSRSSISDFDTLSKIGSGSFGTVYKVRRVVDQTIYVIKDIRIGELSFREQEEAINEVNILAGLESPYIVGYFDSFIENGSLHIVMEFCNRGDLQALVKKAKAKDIACLKEHVTWNIGLQVILGLHYLHEKRILHRDLKSANVFLQKDATQQYFSVKIGDLGVAKLLETSTAFAQTIVGTPYYLSPELVADHPYRDKSDCWAFGVLLYECCTLCHPFEARNQCALIMKIMQSPVEPPPAENVSPQLSKLILWLLQKDPTSRPCINDLLGEMHVREKLIEHGFQLPADLISAKVTNFLNSDERLLADEPYRDLTAALNDEQAQEPDDGVQAKQSSVKNRISTAETHTGSDRDRNSNSAAPAALGVLASENGSKQQSSRLVANLLPTSGHSERGNSLRDKDAGRLSEVQPAAMVDTSSARAATGPSTGAPTRPPLAKQSGASTVHVRGDRVRGGANAKRSTSTKVLTRHQVQQPAPQNSQARNARKSGSVNGVSTAVDDDNSPNRPPAESKDNLSGTTEYVQDLLHRTFKDTELAATLAAGRQEGNRMQFSAGQASADSKLAPDDTLRHSFKDIHAAGVSGSIAPRQGQESPVDPDDGLYAPDFELPSDKTRYDVYNNHPAAASGKVVPLESKASFKIDYEHANDQTISQQISSTANAGGGPLVRKGSALSNRATTSIAAPKLTTESSAPTPIATYSQYKANSTNESENNDSIIAVVEIVNGFGGGLLAADDELIADHTRTVQSTQGSRQSTLHSIQTAISSGSAGPPPNAVHVGAPLERRDSGEVAVYEDDFEDYDDELVKLYQPSPSADIDDAEYATDDDDEEQPLSAEYLAYYGKPDAAQPKAVQVPLEDEFKASLRAEAKLEAKDDAYSDVMSNDSLEEEEDADPYEARQQMEDMLCWIETTRNILENSLGVDLFQSIYMLCKNNMSEAPEATGAVNRSTTYLHEIQKKLQEHLHASLEVVLGTVMQVKALLAWEEELARKSLMSC